MPKYGKRDVAALAAGFKALSNEHRLRIYLRLLACCPPSEIEGCGEPDDAACVGDLGRDLGLAPSTVSHHIKELRLAGLIHLERRGRFIHCAANPESVRRLRAALAIPTGESAPNERSTGCRV